jgi:hypothetical protein
MMLSAGVMLIALCAVYVVFLQPPQLIVYETVDQTAIRVCEKNLADAVKQNTLWGASHDDWLKTNSELKEQLRVCQKYQPNNNILLMILSCFLATGIGYIGRGILDDWKMCKKLKEKEAPN